MNTINNIGHVPHPEDVLRGCKAHSTYMHGVEVLEVYLKPRSHSGPQGLNVDMLKRGCTKGKVQLGVTYICFVKGNKVIGYTKA